MESPGLLRIGATREREDKGFLDFSLLGVGCSWVRWCKRCVAFVAGSVVELKDLLVSSYVCRLEATHDR